MAERPPMVPWPDPPPGPKPSRTTRIWTVVQTLGHAGWLRPRRVGCLLLVLVVLVLAVLWALSAAVNGTVAMFRNDPPPVAGSPFGPATPPPQHPASSGSPTIDRITDRGLLIVAIDETPGLAERPAGAEDYRGFDIALLELVARDLHLAPTDIRYKPLPGISGQSALVRHDVDVAAGGYQIAAGGADPNVAGPYLVSALRLAVPAGSEVTGLDSLGESRVCAPEGSPAAEQLADRLGRRLVTRSSLASCANLLGNRVAAIAGDEISLGALPGVKSGKLREVGEPVGSTEYGIALPPGDPLFRQRVTGVLRHAIEDGTWARLYAQYLGTPVPAPPALPR